MSNITNLSVNTPSVSSGRKSVERSKSDAVDDRRKHYRRPKARTNYIPTPDQLSRMINRALEALANGVYWDRGSIINIVL